MKISIDICKFQQSAENFFDFFHCFKVLIHLANNRLYFFGAYPLFLWIACLPNKTFHLCCQSWKSHFLLHRYQYMFLWALYLWCNVQLVCNVFVVEIFRIHFFLSFLILNTKKDNQNVVLIVIFLKILFDIYCFLFVFAYILLPTTVMSSRASQISICSTISPPSTSQTISFPESTICVSLRVGMLLFACITRSWKRPCLSVSISTKLLFCPEILQRI